jgi:hypothetical protein
MNTTVTHACRKNNIADDNNKPKDIDDGEIGGNYAPLTFDPPSVLPKMWESVLSVGTYLYFGMHLVLHDVVAYWVEQMEDFMKDQGPDQQFEQ